MPPPRLSRLPPAALPGPLGALEIRRAHTPLARLIGLAGLPSLPPHAGLLLPRTRSIHTFGMRFPLDLYWLDREGSVIRVDHAVAPRRLRMCHRARSVVELPATLSAI